MAKNGTYHQNPQFVEQKFRRGMKKHISNLGPNELRTTHSHIVDMYLNESEDTTVGDGTSRRRDAR